MRTVTLALTHFNRFAFLLEAVAQVINDPRIDEIVISDDASTDGSYRLLTEHFLPFPKVKLFRNERNVDCYANKRQAVGRATGEWVILFDSDNVLPVTYLDALFKLAPWAPQTAYLPVWAMPSFDYRAFSGLTVDRRTIGQHLNKTSFLTALNTANFFVNRAECLRLWNGSIDPNTNDSLFQNYNWLKGGNKLYFVPGLQYQHRVHDGSHFKQNNSKSGTEAFRKQLIEKLRKLT
jgi:glycosyltransferase involved in cell wall biosynthesis